MHAIRCLKLNQTAADACIIAKRVWRLIHHGGPPGEVIQYRFRIAAVTSVCHLRGLARRVASALKGSSGQTCLGYWPRMSAFTSFHEPRQKPGRSRVT